jgi:hypothetical protein
MSQDNPLTLPDGGDLLAGGADEDKILEAAAQTAMVNLLFLEQEIGRRILAPDLNNRTLIDMAEHSYKVSGMAKKQEPKTVGERFSITINIPQIGARPPETLVLEANPELPEGDQNTPEALAREAVGLIDWETAPEFS